MAPSQHLTLSPPPVSRGHLHQSHWLRMVPRGVRDGGHLEFRSLAVLSISIRFDSSQRLETSSTRPPSTLPLFSWCLAHWVETMPKLWCETSGIASITCLRFKAAPRQASAEDAYSKCGSLLSTAQSSELGKGRLLDEAHLEKIKSIVSLSSP